MNKFELAYLAGVMDSDGCFTMKRNTYSVRILKDSKSPSYNERVCIKQTAPEAIDLIHQLFGGYKSIQKPNVKNGKPLYSLEIRHQKAHEFIKAVYPYLRIKKRQAEILLELRVHLNKGRTGKVKTMQRTPHGTMAEFTRYVVSEEQISIREKMFDEIRSLNDARFDEKHTALPWR